MLNGVIHDGCFFVDQLFEQQECTCISVTDPRHLYVTKDYIVTHNTLTAEAIAEKLHKPLYQVSAGELGSWDGKIESSLKRILDQAQRWNAIVLMDEADTFLYKRTDGSIERNAVVSTFLRQLEYFNGTMFLTSNRADDIDPAFMSRILQCIKFVRLTEGERATVWKGLVAKQGVTLTDKQANTLAKFDVNGRQIKNVIKVAIALSLGAKKDLSFDIINETATSMHSGKTLTNKGFEK
jgi:SpoVK/Ycf46/Vps4 family AAA+-type ATPase